MEEVDDDESTASEEAEVMDQRRSNNDLVEAYQVLIDAAQAWTSGERLQDRPKTFRSQRTWPVTMPGSPMSDS